MNNIEIVTTDPKLAQILLPKLVKTGMGFYGFMLADLCDLLRIDIDEMNMRTHA